MNPLLTDPAELQRRHDQAHADAQALRHAAIDDFWRGADAVLATAATRARRAAERLAYRLHRRQRLQEMG